MEGRDNKLKKDNKKSVKSYAIYHFEFSLHPLILNDKLLQIDKNLFMMFHGGESIHLEKYNQAIGFNQWKEATKVLVFFSEDLYTKVYKG